MTRIFIVDDHPVVRRGLTQFINSKEGMEVCGDAPDATTAIAAINRNNPDIVIVDIRLRGTNGIELIKAITMRYRSIKTLVLSMHDENSYVEQSLRAGAMGYVLKTDPEGIIIEAINSIVNGEMYLSSSLRDKMIETMIWHSANIKGLDITSLSEREREIFSLIGHGLNTRQIAERLYLSTSTIGTYRERIKSKLNVTSPGELVRLAVQQILEQD